MPAPKPKARYITELLLSILATVEAGDEYHYTPDAVEEHYAFTLDVLNTAHSCFYLLCPDDEANEEMTYEDTEGVRRYDLVVARRIQAATEDPWKRGVTDEIRGEVQDNLVADVKRALRGDKHLTTDDYPEGVALLVQIPLAEMSAEATATPGGGWAIAYVRVEVRYWIKDAKPGVGEEAA